jgi:hypothetical protein
MLIQVTESSLMRGLLKKEQAGVLEMRHGEKRIVQKTRALIHSIVVDLPVCFDVQNSCLTSAARSSYMRLIIHSLANAVWFQAPSHCIHIY